ncbi:sugar transferase [Nocardioides sp. GY 10127]|uniref:sugar transferase n=1 Tax=Nocardioides sp. GY 10127 TaxID=2569762 RepID=UPI001F0DF349|nr:sugar transferase [Nocardioides sp. GY 10127]
MTDTSALETGPVHVGHAQPSTRREVTRPRPVLVQPAQRTPARARGLQRRWLPLLDLLVLVPALLGTRALLGGPRLADLLGMTLSWLVVLGLHGCYRRSIARHRRMTTEHVLAAAGSFGLLLWAGAALDLVDPVGPRLAGALAVTILTSLAVHLAATFVDKPRRLVVLGEDSLLGAAEEVVSSHPGWEHVGSYGLEPRAADSSFLSDAPEVAVQRHADAVLVLPGTDLDAASLRRLAWSLESAGVELILGTGLVDVAQRRAQVTQVGGWSLLHVRHAQRRGVAGVAKSLLDRGAAVGLLVLLAPLLGCLALAVRLDSRGPALFRQERVGRDGRTFTMLKFRSMQVPGAVAVDLKNEADPDSPLFKMRRDPRVTRVGRYLRRYSLDELPQLVNVLRGDMSLVGPRPALPSEVATYREDARRRLHVRPGLTGLWQVSGRSDLSWSESVRMDLLYVDNWSFGLDLSILGRTLSAVLSHRGAY